MGLRPCSEATAAVDGQQQASSALVPPQVSTGRVLLRPHDSTAKHSRMRTTSMVVTITGLANRRS
jgi:hypothetical protein